MRNAMNSQRIQQYQTANTALPKLQYTWPLYGSGIEKLGKNGNAVQAPVPAYGANELLMRIDAISLCFTDLKEIDQGENHPRLKERDLQTNPIIPGHELSMTVVGVGAQLSQQYKVGDRYTIQPDVWVDGESVPFCFGMDGAYRQYAVMDQRILAGDAGNYLIPVPDSMNYSAAAITEPWACVEAAYRMEYRDAFRLNGSVLFLGSTNSRKDFRIDEQWLAHSKPAVVYVCDISNDLKQYLAGLCKSNAIELKNISRQEISEGEIRFDDLLLLDGSAEDVLLLGEHLASGAVIALLNDKPLSESIEIDLGCLHYDEIFYVGSANLNISDAYQSNPARPEFKKGGLAWVLGAGGPMGRMHLQRAIESNNGSAVIVASEVSAVRLEAIRDFFMPLAEKNHKKLLLTNPVEDRPGFERLMNECKDKGGFDDIEVMVTIPPIIAEACNYLAPRGMVNIFAGMKRGVKMAIDAWMIIGERQARFIGHSGSGLDDQKAVVNRCIASQLDPNLSVAAIGGLMQIPDGLHAMHDSLYPGKIVIYPQILDFPLTGLSALKEKLPQVYEKLGENETWTQAAETALLENELPQL
jgi:L-sorbose 1-phosphate reductase